MRTETPGETGPRPPSLLDSSCDGFVYDLAALSPTEATAWGISDHDSQLQDFSPAYWESVADRAKEMLADVDAFDDGTDDSDDDDDFDEVDHVTAAALRDRLRLDIDFHHYGENVGYLNNIDSPVQNIRDTFTLMPTDTPEQVDTIRARLTQVDKALDGYRESLREAAHLGVVSPHRQIEELISQCEDLVDADSPLDRLGLAPETSEVVTAKAAFGRFAIWLADNLMSQAPHEDAVGRERYELYSYFYIGGEVDFDDAYHWGLEQLRLITAEQERLAAELYGPGTGVDEAYRKLVKEERYLLRGTEALQSWLQETSDRVIKELHGTEFQIAEPVRTLEYLIDPAGTGEVFYTPPSDGFSRSGQVWWSVPNGRTTFHTWQELVSVFHQGVPGHHLQAGQAMAEVDNLNLWRRVAARNTGHAEGWAFYGEQLMAELGYFDDPGTYLGWLDAQRLRAARVVIDIGVHLGKRVPDGNSIWDGSYARSFLRDHTGLTETALNFEISRYLGRPGEAPSHALGLRLWREIRDAAQTQGQTRTQFHARALELGSVPMSILREQVLD